MVAERFREKLKLVWPHIRAVLITAHVIAVALLAFPAPEGGTDRASWQDPTVQGEIKAWADTLGTTPEQLEDRLWNLTQAYMSARGEMLAPFSWYGGYCGTQQSWRMFVAPHRFPTRLHIDVHENGTWRPVYIERDSTHRWLGRVLDSYRFRSVSFVLGWPGFGGEFERFARWVARRAERDFPSADRVRVRLFKAATPTPEEVRAGIKPPGEFTLAVELPLGANP